MKSVNLTDPDNPSGVDKLRPSWDYKEAITKRLIELNVPLRVAELVVIDHSYAVTVCCVNKLTPFQAAEKIILEIAKQNYTNKDGSWHMSSPL